MKKRFFLCSGFFFILTMPLPAQDPVRWKAAYRPTAPAEGEIIMTAFIHKGFHIYSQRPTQAGPISTSFTFTPGRNYTLVGETEEMNAREEFDKVLDATVYAFTDTAEFRQKVKLNIKGSPIALKVDYVCCNDGMCFPPKTLELSIKAD